MKIVLICMCVDNGSVGRIVRDLYKNYKFAGYDCKVAIGRGEIVDISDDDVIWQNNIIDVYGHALMSRIFGRTGFYSKKTTKKLIEDLNNFKPDAIHIHSLYGYFINMPLLFNYLSNNNIKVINTLHSCWDFTGHCCYFEYVNCNQWMSRCEKCPQTKSYPSSYFFENCNINYQKKKKLYDFLDNCIIVTPSRWLNELVKKSFLKIHHAVIINNGIDLNVFKYTEKKYFDNLNKPIIMCSANIWEKRKGWDDVIELSYVIPNDIQLVVLGVDEKQEKFLASSTIAIRHTNNVNEMVQLYSQSTVFFNPTYEDNYPTVNLEAICCGCNVVTYNTGGSPETLHKLRHGIVIKHKNYAELLEYTREKSGQKKSFDDVEFYSKERMCLEYIELLESDNTSTNKNMHDLNKRKLT